jgi:hypothetical protein
LGRRLAKHFDYVEGATGNKSDFSLGRGEPAANYSLVFCSKYNPNFLACLQRKPYEVIVDDSIGSFCCVSHMKKLMASYYQMLRPKGLLVTTAYRGARGDQDGGLAEIDLLYLAAKFGFSASTCGKCVYVLTRESSCGPRPFALEERLAGQG